MAKVCPGFVHPVLTALHDDEMAIFTSSYRPKRAPRKKRPRIYPEDMPVIVAPGPMKKRRGPAIRRIEQQQEAAVPDRQSLASEHGAPLGLLLIQLARWPA